MIVLGFMLLASIAVWNSTRQRLGTFDEWRALTGSLAALLIIGGTATLIQ